MTSRALRDNKTKIILGLVIGFLIASLLLCSLPNVIWYALEDNLVSNDSPLTLEDFKENIKLDYLLPCLTNTVLIGAVLLRGITIANAGARVFRMLLYGGLLIIGVLTYGCFGFTIYSCSTVAISKAKIGATSIALGVIAFIFILFCEGWTLFNSTPAAAASRTKDENITLFLITIVIALIASAASSIPFLLDRTFSTLIDLENSEAFAEYTGNIPLGSIVGVNDFYLLPGVLGATDIYTTITSNEPLSIGNRIVLHCSQILTLYSFALFAFGCNPCLAKKFYGFNVVVGALLLFFLIYICLFIGKNLHNNQTSS